MAKKKGRFSVILHEHPLNVELEFAQAVDMIEETDRVTVWVLWQADETSPIYPYPGFTIVQHEEWSTAKAKLKVTPGIPGIYTLRLVIEHLGKSITFKSPGVVVS